MLLVCGPKMFPLLFAFLLLIVDEADASQLPTQNRLVNKMLDSYDKKVKPTRLAEEPVVVTFSMELYQIIEVNERQQFILINAWIVERWRDEFLYWDPTEYDGIEEIMLPHDVLWLPDTTLYNTLTMKDEDTRRLLNAKLRANATDRFAYIELLYPTIYKFSCPLNIYYFPYDSQICKITFGSWTYDKKGIDYFPYSQYVGTSSYLENEGWHVQLFKATRRELKYSCCPNNYTILELTLHIKRKPLFYVINLIVPTCVITLISIIGFFTPSSASGERNEKVTLGITTLLSMSILMLMISDKMPTTSMFIPLIGWFLLNMIFVISLSTIMSSAVIMTQKMGLQGERLSTRTIRITCRLSRLVRITIPNHLTDISLGLGDDDGCSTVVRRNRKGDSSDVELLRRSSSRFIPPSFESTSHLLPHFHNNEHAPSPVESNDIVKKLSAFKAAVIKQRKAISEKGNTMLILVRREYDWLATVIERCSFIVFLTMFIILTAAINVIGLINWLKS
uniref:Uncharacterized protein n=1 Tax=Plectus sambesii TaxID=2011161 RepID=A0A914XEH2_9BILA